MKYSWKGHKDRNRQKNRIKRAGQARLLHIKNMNATSPPREGDPAGTREGECLINCNGYWSDRWAVEPSTKRFLNCAHGVHLAKSTCFNLRRRYCVARRTLSKGTIAACAMCGPSYKQTWIFVILKTFAENETVTYSEGRGVMTWIWGKWQVRWRWHRGKRMATVSFQNQHRDQVSDPLCFSLEGVDTTGNRLQCHRMTKRDGEGGVGGGVGRQRAGERGGGKKGRRDCLCPRGLARNKTWEKIQNIIFQCVCFSAIW